MTDCQPTQPLQGLIETVITAARPDNSPFTTNKGFNPANLVDVELVDAIPVVITAARRRELCTRSVTPDNLTTVTLSHDHQVKVMQPNVRSTTKTTKIHEYVEEIESDLFPITESYHATMLLSRQYVHPGTST